MANEKVTVWVTKYALTSGVFEAEAEVVDGYGYIGETNSLRLQVRIGVTAFFTRSEALANAKQQRDRKVKSLTKQIEKLKAMVFS